MFSLVTQSSSPQLTRTTLRLSLLDERNSPSDLFGSALSGSEVDSPPLVADFLTTADTTWQGVSYAAEVGPTPGNLPPYIRFTNVVVEGVGVITFYGVVEDENPSGLKVTFGSGQIPAMNGKTTTTAADGTFAITVVIGNGSGEVWAETVDAQGLESNTTYTEVF